MAAGDTCYLCEFGSPYWAPGAGRRAARADGVGTCVSCSVHACPQHGERYNSGFKCADCLGRFHAASSISPDDRAAAAAPEPPANTGPAVRRLLASYGRAVTRADAERLRRGARERWPSVAGAVERDLGRAREAGFSVWSALGLRPQAGEPPTDEELVFDPRRPDRLLYQWAAGMDEAAKPFVEELRERPERADWDELAVAIALPVAVRGARLGDSLLRIPGGLTLPPIVAVLVQAYADAPLADAELA